MLAIDHKHRGLISISIPDNGWYWNSQNVIVPFQLDRSIRIHCGFRSMWAGDSSGCGHRKRSDVGSDSVVMWAGKSD